jgi:cation transport regulator
MPYAFNEDLPPSVRRHLPPHAQDIFRSAFNHAWETYGGTEPDRIEEIAHRVAWAAVKRRYRKVGNAWMPREFPLPARQFED